MPDKVDGVGFLLTCGQIWRFSQRILYFKISLENVRCQQNSIEGGGGWVAGNGT